MNKLRFSGETEPWVEKKIDDTLHLHYGKDQKGFEDENGEYPIIGTGGVIGRTNTPLFKGESVLIGRKGTIDKPKYINGGFRTIDTMFYTQMKDNVSATYIHQLFTSIPWRKYNEATGVPSLSSKVILNVSIPLPSLPEQEKIGGFLSALDEEIECQSELVDLLALEYKGYSQRIFSQEMRFKDENGADYPEWEEKKLGEVAEWVNGYAFKPNDLLDEGIPVIKIRELLDNNKLDVRTSPNPSIPATQIINKGDLILSWSMTLATRIWNKEQGYLNQHLYKVIPVQKLVNKEYLHQLLVHEIPSLKNKMHGGTAKHITRPELLKHQVTIPSLSEQEKIGGFLSSLSNRLESEKELLIQLKEQKKAYLQKLLP